MDETIKHECREMPSPYFTIRKCGTFWRVAEDGKDWSEQYLTIGVTYCPFCGEKL